VGACYRIVHRTALTEVRTDLLHRTEPASPCRANQPLACGKGGLSHTGMIGKGDDLVVALDEALLDLLLGSGDHRMREPLSQVHRDQGDNLDSLAGAGGLFD